MLVEEPLSFKAQLLSSSSCRGGNAARRTGPRQTLFNLDNSSSRFAMQIDASRRLKRRRVEGFLGAKDHKFPVLCEVTVENLERKFFVSANHFKIQLNNALV